MNKSIFRKAMENVRQHRDIKFAITEKKRKRFIIRNQKQAHHKFFFSENLSAIEMEQTKLHMKNLSIEDCQQQD